MCTAIRLRALANAKRNIQSGSIPTPAAENVRLTFSSLNNNPFNFIRSSSAYSKEIGRTVLLQGDLHVRRPIRLLRSDTPQRHLPVQNWIPFRFYTETFEKGILRWRWDVSHLWFCVMALWICFRFGGHDDQFLHIRWCSLWYSPTLGADLLRTEAL